MNLFTGLQEGVSALLSADSYFSDAGSETPRPLPVLNENKGDLLNEIQKAIDQIGISTLVITPEIERSQTRNAVTVKVAIGITENVIVNRDPATGTQKAAADVGAKTIEILWGRKPADAWSPLQFLRAGIVDADPLLVYEVQFQTQAILSVT